MTVPVWSPIPDSMVAPEAPVSSDLMTRLRNQWASVFGADPTSLTPPAVPLPPSMLVAQSADRWDMTFGATTSENIVSHLADSLETYTLTPASPDQVGLGQAHIRVFYTDGSSANQSGISFGQINVVYVAGTPSSLAIPFCWFDGASGGAPVVSGPMYNTNGIYNLALDNAWHTMAADGAGNSFQLKARATTTDIFLQMKNTYVFPDVVGFAIKAIGVRSAYKAKG